MADKTRAQTIQRFLETHGWGDAVRTPVPGDASSRQYEWLKRGEERAVLMNAPMMAQDTDDGRPLPDAERQAQGYSAVARLAGNNPHAFICLATELTRRGFSAPHIIGTDIETGLILMENLGKDRVAETVQKNPELEAEIYGAAMSTLAAIYRSSFTPDMQVRDVNWVVRAYDDIALQAEADLFIHWYAPYFNGDLTRGAIDEWTALWRQARTRLDAHAPGLALRDFHAENIFYLPQREGPARVGLIDFQDALFAHPSYDVVSLLEDARRDVSSDLIDPLISQFCAEAGIKDDDDFRAAYAAQGAQRNAKILGIFVRLNTRDKKPRYLDFIPRVAAHFRNDLSHPAMAELKAWTQKYTPSLWEAQA